MCDDEDVVMTSPFRCMEFRSVFEWVRSTLRSRVRNTNAMDPNYDPSVGSIVLFDGRGLFAAIQRNTTGGNFTHVGVICEYNGVKCVAEVNREDHEGGINLLPSNGGKSKAVRIFPFHTGCVQYLNTVGIDVAVRELILPPRGSITRGHINECIIRRATDMHMKGVHFQMNASVFVSTRYPLLGSLIWFLSRFGADLSGFHSKYVEISANTSFCSQFVADCLLDAGIFREYDDGSGYAIAPVDFEADRDFISSPDGLPLVLPWAYPSTHGLAPAVYK